MLAATVLAGFAVIIATVFATALIVGAVEGWRRRRRAQWGKR
jgi:hypothetical protein